VIPGSIEQTKEKSKEKIKEPEMYRVLLHNDDYTTMEFVVEVIMKVFKKPVMEATQIMMQVHKAGKGSVGVYTHDIAATKVQQVRELARQRDFPLKCTMEKA
jgi:ATP-dependent Clp protease adaptor protein ClpS